MWFLDFQGKRETQRFCKPIEEQMQGAWATLRRPGALINTFSFSYQTSPPLSPMSRSTHRGIDLRYHKGKQGIVQMTCLKANAQRAKLQKQDQ